MLTINQLSYWEQKSYFEGIDFVVIGAGIVGLSTAFHLKKRFSDAKIVVLERGYLPTGASSKNAGFACFGSASELLDDLNTSSESLVWETVSKRWQGLNYLKSLIGEKNMDFQQLGSWDILTTNQSKTQQEITDRLDYINQQIAHITGHSNVYQEDKSCASKFGFNQVETAFYNRLEGQIDTGKMIQRFHQLVINAGITVLFGIEVKAVENTPNNVLINTNMGEIHSSSLAVCTNGFAKQLLPLDVSPARAQVLVTSPINDLKIKGTFHYDCGYYYFRNVGQRILLGGGRNLDFEGETTTQLETSKPIMSALKNLLNTVILPNQNINIDYQWAGIMGVGKVKAPLIQKTTDNIGVGVRMGGMGVAIGSLVGKELADLF